MQLSNNVLAVLALAMTATALPARDTSLVVKDTAVEKRAKYCVGIPACCLGKSFSTISQCILQPPANCGPVGPCLQPLRRGGCCLCLEMFISLEMLIVLRVFLV